MAMASTTAQCGRRDKVATRSRLGFLAAALSLPPLFPLYAEPSPDLTITVADDERKIFDYAKSACEYLDIPDTPTRAFRDGRGQMHVFQTHFINRQSVGADLFSLAHDCTVVYRGADSKNPADFDPRSWIASTYSPDGKTVYAIAHNEFQANRWSDICPSGIYMKCWYNVLTGLVSNDAGASFRPLQPRLVASLPFRAEETQGKHAGVFLPTNIVSDAGALYFMAHVVSPAPQKEGNCLFRSTNPGDTGAWRMWYRGSFSSQTANPYGGPVNRSEHLCDPIDVENLPWPVTGIVRHEPTGIWIALMLRTGSAKTRETGVYYSTSRDLLSWNGPALLMAANTERHACGTDKQPISYPMLIDPASTSRNFETVSNRAVLTFVRVWMNGCKSSMVRDVVGRTVTLAALRQSK